MDHQESENYKNDCLTTLLFKQNRNNERQDVYQNHKQNDLRLNSIGDSDSLETNENENESFERIPQDLIDLQDALDNLLEYFQKLEDDFPNYYIETSHENAHFTNEEDNFIINYLHCNSELIRAKGTRAIFQEMHRCFPTRRNEQELENRAVQLCRRKHEINLWRVITNRCQDISIQKDVPEYAEFLRISTLLRHYVLPINDLNHPVSPTLHQ